MSNSAFLVEDLGSRNGTLLNGHPVREPTRLRDGDEIRLGRHTFLFNPDMDLLFERDGDHALLIVPHEEARVAAPCSGSDAWFASVDYAGLRAIHEMTCQLAAELDIDHLLAQLLDRFMGHFQAERGYVLSFDPVRRRFRPLAIRADTPTLAVSRALLDRVTNAKEPLLVRDAVEDVSFVGSRSVVEHGLRSVMLVPLVIDDVVMGVLQLDRANGEPFDQASLARLALLSRVAALALRNARKFQNRAPASSHTTTTLIGDSACMKHLLRMVSKAAQCSSRVLITGESGTGKELVARMLHEHSARREHPFVAVNCGAVPETLLESELFGHERGAFTGAIRRKKGCFEIADGGTLFLDEIGDLDVRMQVKLLRAIEQGSFHRVGGERPLDVDVRIVAATHRDLVKLIAEGRFREDLFYRLQVVEIRVPPLRDRREDLSDLSRYFLRRFAVQMAKPVPTISDGVHATFRSYRWPGNVRELQNALERLMVMSEGRAIGVDDLPIELRTAAAGPDLRREGALHEALANVEREMLIQALDRARGKKVVAARILGISRPTLDKKIRDYGLELPNALGSRFSLPTSEGSP